MLLLMTVGHEMPKLIPAELASSRYAIDTRGDPQRKRAESLPIGLSQRSLLFAQSSVPLLRHHYQALTTHDTHRNVLFKPVAL